VVRDSEERRDEDTVEQRGDAVPQVVVAGDNLDYLPLGKSQLPRFSVPTPVSTFTLQVWFP
jgi:hypothetical protein